jgi:hypothetical protein
MTKKAIIATIGSFVLTLTLLASPAIATQTPGTALYQLVEGECEKCGKKECKGCEKKEAKAEAKESCAGKREGKSCCAHGSKKQVKAEKKTEAETETETETEEVKK